MIEKIITVKSTEQAMAKNNTPYLKVTSQDDKTYSIFDQGLWNLFGQGLAVKLGLEKKGNFWNVMSAESIEYALADIPDKTQPAPQEIGMWWKELGEMMRANDVDVTSLMKTAYYAQMLSVLPIKIEEAKGATKVKAKNKSETGQTGGEALELLPKESQRVKKFLEYLVEHGKKAPRLFLKVEYAVSEDLPLSDTQCEMLYKAIKTKEKW